ncbi:MAG: phosphate/phosphite/phosphonate ABC transporter substrate-binding protein [Rhodocyclaceae bacterium]|nr:phosphate/phosphite/phosphonate ABC transporter substrate-binding protein [Rhodocyclaceae bacterium]
MNRRSCLAIFAALIALAAWPARAAEGLRIGVAPHSSARLILEMYQPLRLFLESRLQQPVEIVTAPDFTEFARRALAQHYDLAITTGHQARLLETDAGYLPLLTYQADFKAVVLVAKDAPYKKPADLAGRIVYGLSPASLVTLWGQHWLHRNGVPGVTLKYVSAADSTARLVLQGEGAAAFHSLANYQSLPAELREGLRILDESPPMVGRVYLLNARHKGREAEVVKALWAFAETAEAKQYFAKYKLGGYRPLGPRELNEMEPYANEVRQALKAAKPASS